jgi:hypothetical protein
MEDVLDVYQRPYDPKRPQVCLDEACKQLLGHKTPPLAAQPARGDKPGHVQRVDYEYERHGVANLFMSFEPLVGRRHVVVRERRTGVDWAYVVKALVDEQYAAAEKIVLVMDNLNTHGVWSLYEAFEPAEAKRLADKLEIHYTPKHGSWLNMAEIELSVLSRQCLQERMESRESLQEQVAAWEERRNGYAVKVDWRFTTADARIKLKRLYPAILP